MQRRVRGPGINGIPVTDTLFRLSEETHRIVLWSLMAVTGALGAWLLVVLVAGPGAGTTLFQNVANLCIVAAIVTFVFRGYRPASAEELKAAETTEAAWEYEPAAGREDLDLPAGLAGLASRITPGTPPADGASMAPDSNPQRRPALTPFFAAAVAPAADETPGDTLHDRLERHLAESEGGDRALRVADLEDRAQGSEPDGAPHMHAGPVRSSPVGRMDAHAGDAWADRAVETVEYGEDERAPAQGPATTDAGHEDVPDHDDDAPGSGRPDPEKPTDRWEPSSTPYIH
jgi:hypothetical protein